MAQVRSTGRSVVLLLTLSCVLGIAVAPGVLAQAGSGAEEDSFGAQMSSFMQSTAADANGTVDRSMWSASVNATEAPGQAVSERARNLQERLQTLENRSEELAAARANGTITGVAYTAQASAIHAELANLKAAINQTMTTADRHGVNESRLADLRQAAGNATGPEIAAIARNITDAGRTPPPWAGDGDGGPNGPTDDNPGAGQGNDSDQGPPDDAPGDGSGNENEGGPPDDGSPGDGGGNADGKSGGDTGGGNADGKPSNQLR